jgi:hypothetical protein
LQNWGRAIPPIGLPEYRIFVSSPQDVAAEFEGGLDLADGAAFEGGAVVARVAQSIERRADALPEDADQRGSGSRCSSHHDLVGIMLNRRYAVMGAIGPRHLRNAQDW